VRVAQRFLFNGLLPNTFTVARVRTVDEMPPSFAVIYRACEAVSHSNRLPRPANELALQVWSGLHGFVTLKANLPGFPWTSAANYIDTALVPLLHRKAL
jgi:hypothetical protein